MKRKQQSVVLAGLLAVALALSGCKGMRSTDDAGETGGSTLGSSTGSSPMTTGSSGASGAMGTGTASSTSAQTQEGATSMPNSTVLAIEPVPKSAATGAVGSSTAGSTGSSGAGEAYRITVRMDDGSTQVLTQDTIPDFRSGDRVHVESGVIHR